MPSTLPKVQGNIPENLYNQLLALQKSQGCSQSKALAMVLDEYFNANVPTTQEAAPEVDETLTQICDRISHLEALERRVEAMEIRERELLTKGIKQLHDRVEELLQAKEQQLQPLDMVAAIMAPIQARIDQLGPAGAFEQKVTVLN